MAIHAQVAPLDDVEQLALDAVLATTRGLIDAILVVEFRLATIGALTERFGTRYAERATIELRAAIDHLAHAEQTRRSAVVHATSILDHSAALTLDALIAIAPEPSRSFLREARAVIVVTGDRINILRDKAEDVLGRRIALVIEAIATPAGAPIAIYGRDHRPGPRLVNGLL